MVEIKTNSRYVRRKRVHTVDYAAAVVHGLAPFSGITFALTVVAFGISRTTGRQIHESNDPAAVKTKQFYRFGSWFKSLWIAYIVGVGFAILSFVSAPVVHPPRFGNVWLPYGVWVLGYLLPGMATTLLVPLGVNFGWGRYYQRSRDIAVTGPKPLLKSVFVNYGLVLAGTVGLFFVPFVLNVSIPVVLLSVYTLYALVSPQVSAALNETVSAPDDLRQRVHVLTENGTAPFRDVRLIRAAEYKHAQTYMTGLISRNRQLFVTDYLYEQLDDEMFDAALAHDLALVERRSPSVLFAARTLPFAAAFAVYELIGGGALVKGVLLIVSGVLLILWYSAYQRLFHRSEYAADARAAERIGVEPMINAIERIAELNDVDETRGISPTRFVSAASVKDRIERLEAFRDESTAA